jgi:hypothetical protein
MNAGLVTGAADPAAVATTATDRIPEAPMSRR